MNGRHGRKQRRDSSREAGAFVALPVFVLESPAYLAIDHPARSLLVEIALQCKGDNNGRLLLSKAHLSKRGWKSADVIQRAKNQLLEAQLIFETVKGCRPNRASWYAVTWRTLDPHPDYDSGVTKVFYRGMYREFTGLTLSPGTKRPRTVPRNGVSTRAAAPCAGTVEALH